MVEETAELAVEVLVILVREHHVAVPEEVHIDGWAGEVHRLSRCAGESKHSSSSTAEECLVSLFSLVEERDLVSSVLLSTVLLKALPPLDVLLQVCHGDRDPGRLQISRSVCSWQERNISHFLVCCHGLPLLLCETHGSLSLHILLCSVIAVLRCREEDREQHRGSHLATKEPLTILAVFHWTNSMRSPRMCHINGWHQLAGSLLSIGGSLSTVESEEGLVAAKRLLQSSLTVQFCPISELCNGSDQSLRGIQKIN
mmetsp:Transcript_12913/g.51557  ORF Transcript_12913/g.51557 Transcript_12913/m.51557 type:complete len:256 (-) Transcript_12913:603-1370(-)